MRRFILCTVTCAYVCFFLCVRVFFISERRKYRDIFSRFSSQSFSYMEFCMIGIRAFQMAEFSSRIEFCVFLRHATHFFFRLPTYLLQVNLLFIFSRQGNLLFFVPPQSFPAVDLIFYFLSPRQLAFSFFVDRHFSSTPL